VEIDLFAGVMKPFGADFERAERIERDSRRSLLQKGDGEARDLDSLLLQERIAGQDSRHFVRGSHDHGNRQPRFARELSFQRLRPMRR
jgi:hypothetical protein